MKNHDMTRQSWHLLALFRGFIWKMHPQIDFLKISVAHSLAPGGQKVHELDFQGRYYEYLVCRAGFTSFVFGTF